MKVLQNWLIPHLHRNIGLNMPLDTQCNQALRIYIKINIIIYKRIHVNIAHYYY